MNTATSKPDEKPGEAHKGSSTGNPANKNEPGKGTGAGHGGGTQHSSGGENKPNK